MSPRRRVDPSRIARALALSGVVSAATVAAHSVHGHVPSLPLVAVTFGVVACLALALGGNRLAMRSTFLVMVGGQFALHAWFSWFTMPSVGQARPTAHVHHGPAGELLAARDFSGLIPSPGMAAAHVIAALVLAVILVQSDWLLSAMSAIVRSVLGYRVAPTVVVVSAPGARVMPPLPMVAPSALLVHDLVRRGPPAYCV